MSEEHNDYMSMPDDPPVLDVEPEPATTVLATRPAEPTEWDVAGIQALARLSDEDFDARIAALKKGMARIVKVQKALLRYGTDYGKIKGIAKPCLFKSGAEKLCLVYGFVATFEPHVEHGDGITKPHVSVLTKCAIHVGSERGTVVAMGLGEANSWERKYRYRRGDRVCPNCEKTGTVIKGKAEYGGGWLCWGNKGGCGTKWGDGDAAIEAQVVGDVENPDPYDQLNTLVKMSGKRSLVDGTMRATGTSALWTQDVEEHGEIEPEMPGPVDASPPPVVKATGIAAARAAVDKPAADVPAHEAELVARLTALFGGFTTVEQCSTWERGAKWGDESPRTKNQILVALRRRKAELEQAAA